ncbi:MAG: stress response translation initiation inhibitor YciH [Acidobacteriota bacterium]|nr:stress response translation initiation inhibitor YciH [Acidobacteriota bacterium]
MTRPDPVRLVYSTGVGRVCATCGWPSDQCKCSSKAEEKVPSKVVVKLRLEKKGRGGKMVTVLGGLPGNSDFLEGLAKDLKKALGTGGSVVGATIELQGEWRERLRVLLPSKNLSVKG